MAHYTTVRNNFSRYASTYDAYSVVQKKTAHELIRYTGNVESARILEIGCGTGNYTIMLKKNFLACNITAMDIADSMISKARSRKKLSTAAFITEKEFFDKNLCADLISSNAVFHWIGEPDKYLARCRDILQKGGIISMSVFGPETFFELADSISEYMGEKVRIEASGFSDMRYWKHKFSEHFRSVCYEEKIFKEKFSDLRTLLQSIKYTGTRGEYHLRPKLWTKGMMKKIESIYISKFGKITASYQVFFLKGIKNAG